MGTIIYRGSTPTIKFKPLNGVSVSELGTPSIAIAQELVYLTPEVTINADDNSITAQLTERETLSLVPGVRTSAQQIWARDNGNIIRYPVHELTVGETIMEEFHSVPPIPPVEELVNLHPFMIYDPFESNGYFEEYFDDGGEAVEIWRADTTPWDDYVDDYMFSFNTSEKESLLDFTIIPSTVSTIFANTEYKLWVRVENDIKLDFSTGGGYSFSRIDGAETVTATLNDSDRLFTLTGGENAEMNRPMFRVRARVQSPASPSKIGFALYKVIDGIPETEYKQYIPYDGGDV